MNDLRLKILILGFALLSIIVALQFNLGTFVSDTDSETRIARIPAAPRCAKGKISRRTDDPYSDSPLDDLSSPSETKKLKLPTRRDDLDLPRERLTRDPYETKLRSSRNSRNSDYDDDYNRDPDIKYIKKSKPSANTIVRAPERYSKIPDLKARRGGEEDDYLDNRLSRDYKRRERQFELPYEKTYNRESTKGYSSGATCNNKSYDENQDEDCCEGFSTFE